MTVAEPIRRSPPGGPVDDPVALATEAFATPPGTVAAFLLRLCALHGLHGRPAVLDVACGAGGRLRALATFASEVVGMESDGRLRATAERRLGAGPAVRAGGLLELDGRAAHDLVLAWDGALAYLPRMQHRLEALQRCADALRPGGLLVLELPNLLWELAHEPPRGPQTVQPRPGLRLTRWLSRELDLDTGLVTRHDRVLVECEGAPAEEVELVHHLSVVTPQELAHGLRSAGFSHVETWGGLGAPEPGPLAGPRMVVVARR